MGRVFSGGSVVKNPPDLQETQVQALGLEEPLEEEMVPHLFLDRQIPWTEEPGGPQSVHGLAENWMCVSMCLHTHVHAHIHTLMRRGFLLGVIKFF